MISINLQRDRHLIRRFTLTYLYMYLHELIQHVIIDGDNITLEVDPYDEDDLDQFINRNEPMIDFSHDDADMIMRLISYADEPDRWGESNHITVQYESGKTFTIRR